MLEDIVIYVKLELKRVGSGPQIGQTKSATNYSVCYGALELGGENKRAAINNMVRALRKMYANDGLNNSEMSVPARFDDADRHLIPASIIMQDVTEYIDESLIKRVSKAS
jgi:hypothetical protein